MDADVSHGITPASSLIMYAQGTVLELFTDYEMGIFFYANGNRVQYARSISTLELLC